MGATHISIGMSGKPYVVDSKGGMYWPKCTGYDKKFIPLPSMKKIIEKVVPKPELKAPEQDLLEKNKLLET